MLTYIDILAVALSGSLLTYFYVCLLAEDMLLEKLGKFVEGKFWLKPAGGCAYCTAPYLTGIMVVLWFFVPLAWQIITTITAAFFILNILFKFEE